MASRGVEVLAVVIMIGFIAFGCVRYLWQFAKQVEGTYEKFRVVLGRTLLIGLELLVAADIIRTVTLELTLTNLALLAGLVVVRTFLGWTLGLEIEHRWPWQKETARRSQGGPEA